MPSKVFNFQEEGLSYSVTLTQAPDGTISATITVHSGHMDVNAIYFGDDNHSGPSAGLPGPLNMNGRGSQHDGDRVQWDGAQKISDPGLGRGRNAEGTKESYLDATTSNNTLTIELEGVNSLDDIDFIGIRATSTSTPEGSIKGVATPEPEVPDEPDCDFKVFFHFRGTDDQLEFGIPVHTSDLNPDIENPTLQDYYNAMVAVLEDSSTPELIANLDRIDIYRIDENGNIGYEPDQTISIDAFQDMPLPCVCVEENGEPEACENDVAEEALAWA